MKINMTRIAGLALTIVMILPLISCSGRGNAGTNTSTSAAMSKSASMTASTGSAARTAPVTLKLYGQIFWGGPWSNTNGVQDDAVAQLVTRDTGITMDIEQAQSDYNDRLAAMIASDDLPDVVSINNPAKNLKPLIENGLIVPVDDFLANYGMNITKYAKAKVDFSRKFLSNETGLLYAFPINAAGGLNMGIDSPFWFARWDLYKQLGYPSYKDFDGFLDVMKKMQELEPKNDKGQKNYALSIFMADWDLWTFTALADYMGVYPEISGAFMDVDVESYKASSYILDNDSSFWTTMRFWNKAYNMGILDPESVTSKWADVQAKGDANRVLAGPFDWFLGNGRKAFLDAGHPEKDYLGMPMPTGITRKRDSSISAYGNTDGLVVISNNCKAPARALQLIDWFHNPDNCISVSFGPRGEADTWDYVNGKPALTDEFFKQNSTNQADLIQKIAMNKYGGFKGLDGSYINPDNGTQINLLGLPDAIEKQMDPETRPDWQDFCRKYGVDIPYQAFKGKRIPWDSAITALLPAAPDDIKLIDSKLMEYIKAAAPKLTLCKDAAEFDAMANQIKDKCNSMGIEKSNGWWTKAISDTVAKLSDIKKR